MDRYIILVDAGYLFAAGGVAISPDGKEIRRADLALKEHESLLRSMREVCDPLCAPASLLRMHWYDAPPKEMTPSSEQEALGRLPGIKLRLGNLNSQGKQKGVDSLIITDLIDLARNSAICDVVLVSGDEDVRVGVSVAQGYGVRVHLLGIGDARHNTSPRLLMESDGQVVVDKIWIQKVLEIRRPPVSKFTPHVAVSALVPAGAPSTPPTSIPMELTQSTPEPVPDSVEPATTLALPAPTNSGDLHTCAREVISDILARRTTTELTALQTNLSVPKSSIPPEYDGRLLATVGNKVGRRLSQVESGLVRQLFRNAVSNFPA